jgi:hypothetical protein
MRLGGWEAGRLGGWEAREGAKIRTSCVQQNFYTSSEEIYQIQPTIVIYLYIKTVNPKKLRENTKKFLRNKNPEYFKNKPEAPTKKLKTFWKNSAKLRQTPPNSAKLRQTPPNSGAKSLTNIKHDNTSGRSTTTTRARTIELLDVGEAGDVGASGAGLVDDLGDEVHGVTIAEGRSYHVIPENGWSLEHRSSQTPFPHLPPLHPPHLPPSPSFPLPPSLSLLLTSW